MSDTGESADPGQNGPAHQPSELGDGGPRSLPPGFAGRSDGMPRGAADSEFGSESGSSEAWHRLLQAARGGCRESQAALFTAVRQKLVTFANQGIDRCFQSKIDGSDVVQQTLIDAACGIATFRGETRDELMAWLEGILIHRLADTRRHFIPNGRTGGSIAG